MTQDWQIFPNQGLGRVRLEDDMTTTLEHAFAFGEVTSDDMIVQGAGAVFETLVAAFGREEALASMAMLAENGVNMQPRRRLIFATGVHLDFVDDRLDEIMCDRRAEQAHVDGIPVFGQHPLPALRRLRALNTEPPLLKGSDCYFRNLHITAFGFLVRDRDNSWRVALEGTDESAMNTINIRATPRNPNEDFSAHSHWPFEQD